MKATGQLKAEHEGIRIMLRVLDKIGDDIKAGAGVDAGHLHRIIEFLKVFVDRCHHGKEEDVLFPALERAGVPGEGGPIGVLLAEHETGRARVRAMAAALSNHEKRGREALAGFADTAGEYTALLDQHIEKENTVLYVMADRLLSEGEQEKMFAEFERIESERIGAGTHERFHALIGDLQGRYLR
ncbi:MAG: hemerythrin domain-containing protein [bacterium]|nr:hemerythrin domain-containing protein [bacterium]